MVNGEIERAKSHCHLRAVEPAANGAEPSAASSSCNLNGLLRSTTCRQSSLSASPSAYPVISTVGRSGRACLAARITSAPEIPGMA
jgi:hypothetical protein